jgi:hypothetical protein
MQHPGPVSMLYFLLHFLCSVEIPSENQEWALSVSPQRTEAPVELPPKCFCLLAPFAHQGWNSGPVHASRRATTEPLLLPFFVLVIFHIGLHVFTQVASDPEFSSGGIIDVYHLA